MNEITNYTSQLLKSDFSNVMSDICSDYKLFSNDNAFYYPNYFAETNDFTIFNKLKNELSLLNKIEWANKQHFIFESPELSITFVNIVKKLEYDFNIKISETRLNYYKNGNDFKKLHQDKNAFSDTSDNYTIGCSFGNSRELIFKHINSNEMFKFPQCNGDVFGFNNLINKKFMHGIPKTYKSSDSALLFDRFSIIVWGKKCDNFCNFYNKIVNYSNKSVVGTRAEQSVSVLSRVLEVSHPPVAPTHKKKRWKNNIII